MNNIIVNKICIKYNVSRNIAQSIVSDVTESIIQQLHNNILNSPSITEDDDNDVCFSCGEVVLKNEKHKCDR
jgi:hypothetical protein